MKSIAMDPFELDEALGFTLEYDSEEPHEWRDSDPNFAVPEYAPLGCAHLSPAEMSRHFLIVGETGSGKTKSGILPTLRAAARYACGSPLAPAALVIDPKRELLDHVRGIFEHDAGRFSVFDIHNPEAKIHFFAGRTGGGGEEMLTAEAISKSILGLSRYVLAETQSSRDAFWIQQAKLLFSALVGIDLHVLRGKSEEFGTLRLGRFWADVARNVGDAMAQKFQKRYTTEAYRKAWKQLACAMEALEMASGLKFPMEGVRQKILASWWQVDLASSEKSRAAAFNRLQEILWDHPEKYTGPLKIAFLKGSSACTRISELTLETKADGIDGSVKDLEYDPETYLVHHKTLVTLATQTMTEDQENVVLRAFLETADAYGIPMAESAFVRSLVNLARNTFTSVVAVYMNILEELTRPELMIALSLNPFEAPQNSLDIREIRESGRWVVFAPSKRSTSVETVGRALKAKFFEATFRRSSTSLDRPFFYFCDEFHRFVTSDPESGEQNFLDRCRAFRGICVLATQSVASLRHALGDAFSDPTGAALDVMIGNCGNKFFFRSTDLPTVGLLQNLIPGPKIPGRPHVVEARPTSTLSPGECYFMLSNGAWGRGKVSLDL